MFTKKFWVDTAERVFRTFAQALVGQGIFDTVSVDMQTNIKTKVLASLMTAGTALLMALAGQGFGQKDSASWVDTKGDDGQLSWSVGVIFVVGLILGYVLGRIGFLAGD